MKYKMELFLFILWLLVQSLLLYQYGIITNNEAIKYHREAINILQHQPFSENKYIFYSVYIFLHVLFQKLSIETVGVYIFQLLFNLFATYLFFKLLFKLYAHKIIAALA